MVPTDLMRDIWAVGSGNGCPVCRDPDGKDALWWSKAGMTSSLCEAHREAARSQRRLRAEFKRHRDAMFTVVRMEERR